MKERIRSRLQLNQFNERFKWWKDASVKFQHWLHLHYLTLKSSKKIFAVARICIPKQALLLCSHTQTQRLLMIKRDSQWVVGRRLFCGYTESWEYLTVKLWNISSRLYLLTMFCWFLIFLLLISFRAVNTRIICMTTLLRNKLSPYWYGGAMNSSYIV